MLIVSTCCWIVPLRNWMPKIIWEGKCRIPWKRLQPFFAVIRCHSCLLLHLADPLCTMLQLTGTASAQSPWWEPAPRSMSWIWRAAALCTTPLLHTPFVGERERETEQVYCHFSFLLILLWHILKMTSQTIHVCFNVCCVHCFLFPEGKQTLSPITVMKSNRKPHCKTIIDSS